VAAAPVHAPLANLVERHRLRSLRPAMVIQEMTEQECYAMLATARVARLACARSNQPYIVPLHVNLKGSTLYGYTTLGQKVEWMRLNPRVCLEADDVVDDEHWASVIVFGYYEELPNTPEHEGARAIAQELFQRRPAWWEPAGAPVGARDPRAPIVFRIQISRVSGRRGTPDGPVTKVNVMNAAESSKPRWWARALSQLTQRPKRHRPTAGRSRMS
jgi:nitroimidazol reductase NimA-like FMN-containing flavoprotein (pyridoxamine 5'-phosphate oxidase superfamily)